MGERRWWRHKEDKHRKKSTKCSESAGEGEIKRSAYRGNCLNFNTPER